MLLHLFLDSHFRQDNSSLVLTLSLSKLVCHLQRASLHPKDLLFKPYSQVEAPYRLYLVQELCFSFEGHKRPE